MTASPRNVILTAFVWFAVAGAACTQKEAEEARDTAREGAATAAAEVQEAGDAAADKTREIAGRTADKAKEIVSDIATTTGEAISDTWITAKVKAKFLDETLLEGSSVTVETDNHVVTLRGTVASVDAKSRAAAIASGTEGVTRVINHLVVT
jgi:osmotically-inducible protein OsmY